jgi:dipeptidyl aminopeptidase/acylaminoacyl peptidase
MRKLALTLIAVFAFVVFVPAHQADRRFGLDDFSKLARVNDPQIAPDDKSIAVVISRPNLDENRHVAEIVLVDIASGAQKKLVTGLHSVSSPRWAPNGEQIAFLATATTPAQLEVFVVSAKGGAPKQITTAPRGVQQIAWSPDSKTIAFASADEPEKKTGPERFNLSFEVTPTTNVTMTAALTPTHLWVVPAAGGEAKRLTSGTWTLPISRPPGPPASTLAWTKDSSSIVFARQGGGGPGVQAVNVATGAMTPLNGVNGTFPQFAPTGDGILVMAGSNVVVYPGPGPSTTLGAGGQAKNLTLAIDRGIARATWMPDAKAVLVGGNDTERVSMWLQPLEGPAQKIDVGDLSPNSSYFVDWSVGKNGAIAFTATSPLRPAELYYMSAVGATPKRLTDVNAEAAALPLGKTDTVEWTNDNFKENGMLTYPPDFDASRKYPLVLVIHGGPRAASMRTFSPAAQLLAAKGWLVFQPNYRGSDNLGAAYQGAIRNDAGEGPGRDVMAGIEMLKAKGFVDETRLGVSGWSYGGYMTTWMLGHYDIWKAAVTGASVTNQLDQYNLSDGAGAGRGNNSPWLNTQVMDRMRAQSPITNAHKIKAPTLILHNVGDYRVTITQSYELYHALIDAGVTTEFVAYPIPGHNAVDPVHQRDVQRRWIGWFEKHLK